MNPIPETICAATREGSRATSGEPSRSSKPYFEISMNAADPTPTRVCVRRPALFAASSRSMPISVQSTSADASGASSRHCCG